MRLPRNDSSQFLTSVFSVLEGCTCPLAYPLPSSLLESVFCPDSRVTLKNLNQPVSEPSAWDLPVGFQTPRCPRVLSAASHPHWSSSSASELPFPLAVLSPWSSVLVSLLSWRHMEANAISEHPWPLSLSVPLFRTRLLTALTVHRPSVPCVFLCGLSPLLNVSPRDLGVSPSCPLP